MARPLRTAPAAVFRILDGHVLLCDGVTNLDDTIAVPVELDSSAVDHRSDASDFDRFAAAGADVLLDSLVAHSCGCLLSWYGFLWFERCAILDDEMRAMLDKSIGRLIRWRGNLEYKDALRSSMSTESLFETVSFPQAALILFD